MRYLAHEHEVMVNLRLWNFWHEATSGGDLGGKTQDCRWWWAVPMLVRDWHDRVVRFAIGANWWQYGGLEWIQSSLCRSNCVWGWIWLGLTRLSCFVCGFNYVCTNLMGCEIWWIGLWDINYLFIYFMSHQTLKSVFGAFSIM